MTISKLEDAKKKKEGKCMFCGKEPACYAWTCPRLAAVAMDEEGSWSVEYAEDWEEDA